MNRNDLRRVDLNLLIVFETLMHERSVTRAAEKLFLGQPAISAALSRLRGLFDDPLFVRTGRSMEPSARAVEIFALLSPALDSISTARADGSMLRPVRTNSGSSNRPRSRDNAALMAGWPRKSFSAARVTLRSCIKVSNTIKRLRSTRRRSLRFILCPGRVSKLDESGHM